MKIRRAVITAAGRGQRRLPLQELVDRDGRKKSVLRIVCDEIASAGVERVAVVIRPEDEAAYRDAVGDSAARVTFVMQPKPVGYGDALVRARTFVDDEPFLHVVADHLFVARGAVTCARQLLEIAEREDALVSAVQSTREGQITHFGVVGGRRVAGRDRLYDVDRVLEKPTPTVAEQELVVPGLRAGRYLCFFGMHALTPAVLAALEVRLAGASEHVVTLADALADQIGRQRYLAFEIDGVRHDLGDRYGLFAAQLELGLGGVDRDLVLETVLEVLAQRERGRAS